MNHAPRMHRAYYGKIRKCAVPTRVNAFYARPKKDVIPPIPCAWDIPRAWNARTRISGPVIPSGRTVRGISAPLRREDAAAIPIAVVQPRTVGFPLTRARNARWIPIVRTTFTRDETSVIKGTAWNARHPTRQDVNLTTCNGTIAPPNASARSVSAIPSV